MSVIGTFEEPSALVPPGRRPAMVKAVREMAGPHGALVRIEFQILSGDEFEGRTVTGLANKRMNETTKLGRWIASLLGHTPAVGEEIAVEDLLFKECLITIGHKSNGDGKVYANVIEVLPAEENEEWERANTADWDSPNEQGENTGGLF